MAYRDSERGRIKPSDGRGVDIVGRPSPNKPLPECYSLAATMSGVGRMRRRVFLGVLGTRSHRPTFKLTFENIHILLTAQIAGLIGCSPDSVRSGRYTKLERAGQVTLDREKEWIAMATRNARVLYEDALLRSANPTHALMGDPPPGLPRLLYEQALLRSANPTHALMGDPPPG